MSTRILTAVDALVEVATTAMAGEKCAVYDGPVPTAEARDFLVIGDDADPQTEEQALAVAREWAGLGARRINEALLITCAFFVRDGGSGAGAPRRVRTRLVGLFLVLENAIRANPSLGQAPPFIARVQDVRLLLDPTTGGQEGRLLLTVAIETRTT